MTMSIAAVLVKFVSMRHYPLVLSIALGLLAAAACLATSRSDELGSDGNVLNGMAPLYAPFPSGQGPHGVRAQVTLPLISSNKQWYANWIMIVGTAPSAKHQIFVQVGIIRRPGLFDGIRSFVSWQGTNDATIGYREYDMLADREHELRIQETPDGFAPMIDGKPIGNAIAIRFSSAYAQVGPEVYAEGDRLSGSVSDASVSSGAVIDELSGSRVCRYENHGVVLVAKATTYTASGVFMRSLPSTFFGDCSGI
jgi:hypothetical protein